MLISNTLIHKTGEEGKGGSCFRVSDFSSLIESWNRLRGVEWYCYLILYYIYIYIYIYIFGDSYYNVMWRRRRCLSGDCSHFLIFFFKWSGQSHGNQPSIQNSTLASLSLVYSFILSFHPFLWFLVLLCCVPSLVFSSSNVHSLGHYTAGPPAYWSAVFFLLLTFLLR